MVLKYIVLLGCVTVSNDLSLINLQICLKLCDMCLSLFEFLSLFVRCLRFVLGVLRLC